MANIVVNTDTAIAANRFGLGARPGDWASIGKDPRKWLLSQLDGKDLSKPQYQALPTSPDVIRLQQDMREARRQAKKKGTSKDKVKAARRKLSDIYRNQANTRTRIAATSEQPFRERLVHFWSNHFAISADKQTTRALCGCLENEAIRPHVTGSFSDMLLAVTQHPSMLLYLDNWLSVGPHSQAGQKSKRGLNENLAREILELHTLGVNGGYQQHDVIALSKVLTGWSIGGLRRAGGRTGRFYFNERTHESGRFSILGKRYSQKNMRQGKAALEDLATHSSTARHIATKLAQHFIADEPPAAAIDKLANNFVRTGGNLKALYRTLIELDESWHEQPGKYKTPNEFAISAMRALDQVPEDKYLLKSLQALGQPPYMSGSPAGWPDHSSAWDGATALMQRIEWAGLVSQRASGRIEAMKTAETALGPLLSNHTRTAIARAESQAQALTLALLSPEFQRR